MTITTIGLDGDDTLWHNEKSFREAEQHFVQLLENCADKETIENVLFSTISRNIGLYGYGFKPFTLSMIEAANLICKRTIPSHLIKEILSLGRGMMEQPVKLIDNVVEILETLHKNYRLLLVSKGDLVEQARKLAKSGLADYFDRIEIVSHKDKAVYEELLKRNGLNAKNFVMIGNSLKSDILPALAAGTFAVYIPYEITWIHEMADEPYNHEGYFKVEKIALLPPLVQAISSQNNGVA